MLRLSARVTIILLRPAQCFLIGSIILVIAFILSTEIREHFYFISVSSVDSSRKFSFYWTKNVICSCFHLLSQV